MNKNLLNDLIRTRIILKKKLRSIKVGESNATERLEETFKPITEPLREIIKSNNIRNTSGIEHITPKNDLIFTPIKPTIKINTSTPKKEFHKKEDDDHYNDLNDNSSNIASDSETLSFNSANNSLSEINLSLLEKQNKLDTVYGPHKEPNGEWKFGNSNLVLAKDKIIIGNQHWALSPGLVELLFYKAPKQYEDFELNIYKNILMQTNAHKREHNSRNQIKGSKSKKYNTIIKKLFKKNDDLQSKTKIHKGEGMMMKFNNQKSNYIYWDDPNELVNRLRLLVASEGAGNNNHQNEINSIIEELREANIIV